MAAPHSFGFPNLKGGTGILSILIVPLASSFVSSFPLFEKLLKDNPILAAGLAFILVTTLSDYFKLFINKIKKWSYSCFCASVSLDSRVKYLY